MNDLATRALSLFDDFVDLPANERERKLLELAARDPALHATLRALLDADAHDANLLDRSPVQILAAKHGDAEDTAAASDERADARLGTHLGPWRIDRAIGHGGMGTVYEAHRDDGEYRQRVALKCIRTELATPQLLAAFRDERNLLARLDHPGIAALVDGGVGEDGQPWFAMRYVDGVALDVWCDRRRATVRERVGLLIQVCEALGYAHAQGIVHRDIKPSNLLVTEDGRVQLVDFGISSHFAAHGVAPREQIAITSDYAAPEARDYGAHGPATDLYALGVLTYRLLCAQWPAPLHSLRNLIPIAASGEPVLMDRLLDERNGAADAAGDNADFIARQRGAADAAALRKQLTGDLSAIALKAVATRPQDRYASASEFADDLRRWGEHRPVSVNPGSWLSRARKWYRRSPAAALLAAALSLALFATLGLSLWQQHRATREAQTTQTVGDLFATTLGTATLSGLGNTPFSSKAMLEKTERELRRLPLDNQPQLRARSLATLARAYATIGDYRRAEALADEAQTSLGGETDPDGFVAATRLSTLNNQARYAQAMRLARAQIEPLDGRDDVIANTSRVVFGAELAQAQWNLGQTRDAMDTADALVARAAALGPGHEDLYAEVLILRSSFLYRLARATPAEADARRAIAVARPVNAILADDALEKLVRIVQMRPNLDARALAKELLQRRTRTLGPSHPKTAQAAIRLSVFPDSGLSKQDVAQALVSIRNAYGTDNPQYASAVASAGWAIARDRQDTIGRLRAAVRVLDTTLPAHSELRFAAKHNLGLVLLFQTDGAVVPDEIREGLNVLRQAIAAERKAGLPTISESELLAWYLADRGDNAHLPELERLLRDLRAEIVALFGPGNYRLRDIDFFHNKLLFRQGHHERADRGFARMLADDHEFVASGDKALTDFQNRSTHLIWALAYRGFHALETCRKADAVDYLEQAVTLSVLAPLNPPDEDQIARAYLAGVRQAQIPGLAPQVLPDADREQINRAARQCQRGTRRDRHHSPGPA